MKKIKDVLPQSKLCDVFRALFESHIRQENVVWESLSSAELQTLQRLQNRALSIIASARYKDPWPKNWLNVENLILFDKSIAVYKILNKLCAENFWNMFQLRSSLSDCDTRNYKDIHIPMLKLESTKNGFQYAGTKAWNNLPLSIRELSSLSLFKSHLKKHFMSNEN